MVRVQLDSAREIGPRDCNGASSWRIDEGATVFSGSPVNAGAFLRALPVGQSVTVRHEGGLRSCMNKPALWPWVEALRA